MPMSCPAAGSGTGSGTSTWKVTNHRRAGSRVTVTLAGSRLAGHVRAGPGPHERDRLAHLRQPQHTAPHAERAAGVGGGLAPPVGLEPRVAGPLGEERPESLVLVAKDLLERDRGHLVEECPLGLALHGGQRPVGLGVRGAFALGGVALMPGSEGAVPHHPDAPERARQGCLLSRAGVRPAPIRHPHAYRRTAMAVNQREARRTGFLPASKGRGSACGLQ